MNPIEERYAHGKIYKIVSPNTDRVYIGSTCLPTLAKRMAYHCTGYRAWKQTGNHYVSSFDLFEAGDAQIVLLENYPCQLKDELRARENHWMNEHKDVLVNKQVASVKMPRAEYKHNYYLMNREKYSEKNTEYYMENRDTRFTDDFVTPGKSNSVALAGASLCNAVV